MLEFFGYHGPRGCIPIFIEFLFFVGAIFSIATGEAKARDWGIVIGVVVDALLAFFSRWAERHRQKRDRTKNPGGEKSPPGE